MSGVVGTIPSLIGVYSYDGLEINPENGSQMAIERYKNGWRVVVYAGAAAANLPAPHTGKARVTKVVNSSHADAKRLEREIQSLVDKHRGIRGGITASEYATAFLDKPESPSTRATYHYALKGFLEVHGDRPLSEWTVDDARALAREATRGNVAVIRNLFTKAFEDGHIPANPFRDIKAQTKGNRKTKEHFHRVWPQDPADQRKQLSRMIEVAREKCGTDTAAMFAWSAWTGTRPGEAFVLRRNNLDLPNGMAYIVGNFDRGLGAEKEGTKNRLTREIVVPPIPELRNALADLTAHIGQPYVFTNNGKPWKPGSWYQRWTTVKDSLNLHPEMVFYDLRHFCATQFLELGISQEDVAVQLGHTDGGELVRSVYGHPSEDAARARIRHTLTAFADQDQHTSEHTTFQQRRWGA